MTRGLRQVTFNDHETTGLTSGREETVQDPRSHEGIVVLCRSAEYSENDGQEGHPKHHREAPVYLRQGNSKDASNACATAMSGQGSSAPSGSIDGMPT